MRSIIIAFTLIVLGFVPPVFGQTAQNNDPDPALLDALPFDSSVPTSPAFTILGVTPKDVTSPSDAEGLGVSLLNATDQNGVLQTGIAIDTNPYLVLRGPKLTIDGYIKSSRQQFLSRMKLSVATTKASKDAKDTHAALGLLFVPLNTADPRLDPNLGKCLKDELAFKPTETPVPPESNPGGSQAVPLGQATLKMLNACHEDFVKRQKDDWNAQSWMIGVAAASVTDNGKVDNLQSDGVGIWTSYSRQFAFGRVNNKEPKSDVRRGQLIVHGRYRTSEHVKPEGSDTTIDQDSSLFGARLRIGAPEFGGSLEASYIHKEPEGGKSDTHFRVLLGAERLLFGSTWLEIAIGRDVGRQDGDDVVIRSAFRWSFTQSRKF